MQRSQVRGCQEHNRYAKFKFSSHEAPSFTGQNFYAMYKYAEFLKDHDNVVQILTRGHQLRHKLRDLAEGTTLVIEDMKLTPLLPLTIKKSGPKVVVEDHEFTFNRLAGLAAAYSYEYRKTFPELEATEAIALGLSWDNTNAEKCRLYLSAVSGSEHFFDQFLYYPLICALRKMQLNKMKAELVVKIAKIKTREGDRIIQLLQKNREKVKRLWRLFPGSTPQDFERILKSIDQ